MSPTRLRRLIPRPVKRVLRRVVDRVRRPTAPPPPTPKGGKRTRRLEKELRQAQRRIRKLKRHAGSDEQRWSRQREALVGRRSRPLVDLAYFPAGDWNAYMRLLYARGPEFGFDPRPLDDIAAADDLPPTSVLHLHWTRAAQLGAKGVAEARAQTTAFLGPIERFVDRGGVLVWSIHEALPHDCRFPEVERALRRRLAGLAHGIHILHPSTVEAVRSSYPLDPAKVFVVEHPLYTGAYPDFVGRAAARRVLDLADDTVLLLAFGAIRPYKGFDRVVRLLPRIRRETGVDVRVMIAGRTIGTEEDSALRELVAATEGASMTEDGPPEGAVHVLFRAADLTVLPYREFLNSGVLLLSLTFGVPAIVPRTPVSADMAASGLVHFFEAGSDDDLAAVVIAAVRGGTGPGGALPAEFTRRHDPHTLSGAFGERLREVVSRARRGK